MLSKLLRGNHLKKLQAPLEDVNSREEKVLSIADDRIQDSFQALKGQDDIQAEGFALVREAARRALGQRHFDVQVMGGITLDQGRIAEMKTGEGKTLTSTLAIALNALNGDGVHVVTTNDYLAGRDCEWMSPVYRMLGLEARAIREGMSFDERREAYRADITYGSNSEFGFDYLRDNLAKSRDKQVQRPLNFAVIDEIDSVLIDDSRTPLIISCSNYANEEEKNEAVRTFREFAALISSMKGRPGQERLTGLFTAEPEIDEEDYDYEYDEKNKAAWPTNEGILKAEKMIGGKLHESEQINMVNHLRNAILAEAIMVKDRDYTIVGGNVKIIDQNTGRIQEDQQWANGLHQAVEAKEGLKIKPEHYTQATITYRNFFAMYPKLAGMTGTAITEASEFKSLHGLDVVSIPTHEPVRREDHPDKVYETMAEKWQMVVKEIKTRSRAGQPVLAGTASIESSELLSGLLKKAGVKHRLLNAKPDRAHQEAEIISRAGQRGQVTISTNMAGRGVDIKLGGENGDPDEIRELGGLFVIGTERHESKRIDNQLRGRSGRQGDPGESVFYLSAEDDLIRLFAGEKMKRQVKRLQFLRTDDEPFALEFKGLTKAIDSAQYKVEQQHFLTRKELIEYDDVMQYQRESVYGSRNRLLDKLEDAGDPLGTDLELMITGAFGDLIDRFIDPDEDFTGLSGRIGAIRPEWTEQYLRGLGIPDLKKKLTGQVMDQYHVQREKLGERADRAETEIMLWIVDHHWRQHLVDMDILRTGIHLRSIAQEKPVAAYAKEADIFFMEMNRNIWTDFARQYLNATIETPAEG